jgi:lipoprotein-releasing system ATP-binding protein
VADEVLRLDGIRKSYAVGTPAESEILHGIDLTLVHGEFAALIGPSGSGKSTLLNIVGLLDRPSGGGLVIEGRDTRTLTEDELTRLRGHTIGFVFQYHYLLSAFTALENVMMPLLLERGRPNAAMRDAAETLLDRVGLRPWRDNLVTNMSGGQQQRVAIARALALKPAMILADEPTGNLDTKSAEGVFELMRDVCRTHATTFLLVTHNLSLAARCDRTIELVDGRIVSDHVHEA